MRQFYLDLPDGVVPTAGERFTLDRDESHHLSTVLRGGRQEQLVLVDGRGHRMTAQPLGGDGKRREVEILAVGQVESEMRVPHLHLACAMVKGRRMEWMLEKAVELGVHRIMPLVTERGSVLPRDGKQSRWRTLLVAALKQSGRAWLPELTAPRRLADILADDSRFLFGAVPQPDPPRPALGVPGSRTAGAESLTLLVGPEGGWTPAEEESLFAGATPIDLGPHVLRTETAAVVGLYALQVERQRLLATAASQGS